MLQTANLVFRFLLELAGLAAAVRWGFAAFDGFAAIVAGVGLPLAMASLWGVFRVPNDGGPPVVTVSGPVRLGIEALFFGLAIILLTVAGDANLALILAAAVVIHYAIDWRRTALLAMNRPLPPMTGPFAPRR